MNKQPLVSVCIPLYNAADFIANTICKVLQQTYDNIEIVIVDDHSTDNSLSIAKSFESDKVRVYTNPKKGGNPARNYAFEMSCGKYVKFLDADDYCSDNMILAQMERMLKDGSCDTVVISAIRMIDPYGRATYSRGLVDHDYIPGIELLVDIWRGNGWRCPHCHLMHRSLIEKVGRWDESIIKNQDGEFFARIYTAADKALFVPEEMATWYQTGTGVSRKISVEAHRSVIRSYDIIADLLLNYQDTQEIKTSIAKRIGGFVYEFYPSCEAIIPDIKVLLKKLHTPLIFPERKILKVLSTIFGWKIALRIIHKFGL